MKNELRGIATALLAALAMYLAGSFCFADFNIAAWPEMGRLVGGLGGGWFVAGVYMHATGKMA